MRCARVCGPERHRARAETHPDHDSCRYGANIGLQPRAQGWLVQRGLSVHLPINVDRLHKTSAAVWLTDVASLLRDAFGVRATARSL
jgi:hypothetical protein